MIWVIEFDDFCDTRYLCDEYGFFTNESDAEHFCDKLGEHYWVVELLENDEV